MDIGHIWATIVSRYTEFKSNMSISGDVTMGNNIMTDVGMEYY